MIVPIKPGRSIALDGIIDDQLIEQFNGEAISHFLRDGAEKIIAHIIEDCAKLTKDDRQRCTRVAIRAVVLAHDEYTEAINQAYLHGLHDGRSKP